MFFSGLQEFGGTKHYGFPTWHVDPQVHQCFGVSSTLSPVRHAVRRLVLCPFVGLGGVHGHVDGPSMDLRWGLRDFSAVDKQYSSFIQLAKSWCEARSTRDLKSDHPCAIPGLRFPPDNRAQFDHPKPTIHGASDGLQNYYTRLPHIDRENKTDFMVFLDIVRSTSVIRFVGLTS